MLTRQHPRKTWAVGELLLAALLVALGTATVAAAQITEEQPVLPDLAPREVEIRGQLQIAFPSLQRQPLVGFNPPPRVPEIPLTRRPFLEDYADAGANFLRANLNPPEPPGVTALTGEGPLRAEVELSAGRFFQRRVHAIGAARMQSNQKVEIRLRYLGTDGDNVGFQGASNKNDDFAGSFDYERSLGAAKFGARIEGFASGYSLYGLDTTDTSGRIALNPDRNARSADESAWVSSAPGASFDYRLTAGLRQTRIESDLFATQSIVDPGTERTERRAYIDAETAVPIGSGKGFLQGRYETAGLDASGLAGSDVKHGQVAAGFRYESATVAIEGAPALLAVSFDGGIGGQPGETRSASYLSPQFDVRLRTGQR
ncbi:MAG: hypothetical protein R3282_01640, partial [Rhodothermales bacterium]|nr:hypothetical protein [Rhodothermales bacterium]